MPCGGCGVGLRLNKIDGSHVSEGWGLSLGAPQASQAWVGGANALCSSLAPLSWRTPPACLSCCPPASLLCPQDHPGTEGSSEGVEPSRRAGRLLGRLDRGNAWHAPPWSYPLRIPPGVGTPTPTPPPLRGTGLFWPPLLFPPQSPHILLVGLGVPPVSLGIEVPHQRLAGALVVGRCEHHVFPCCHLDSAPQDEFM